MLLSIFKFFGFLFQTLAYSIFLVGVFFTLGPMFVGIIELLSKHQLSSYGKRALSCFAICIGVALAVFCSIRDTYPEAIRSALPIDTDSLTESAERSSNSTASEHIPIPPTPEPSKSSSQSNHSSFSSETSSAPLTDDITGPLSTPAWWTEGGHSYHFSPSCPSLSRSSSVQSGTLSDALDAGKYDPCNICAYG